MKIFAFYIPFGYSYISRFKSLYKFVSWIVIYMIPTLYFFLCQSSFMDVGNYISYVWALLLIYTLYEVGYIQNDFETIKKESNPTVRFSKEMLEYYNTHKVRIYLFRLFLGVLFSYLLYCSFDGEVVYFLISVWSLLLIYQLYNRIRSRLNLYLHFGLVLIRYCSYFLLFVPHVNGWLLGVAIIGFPVINFLERASEQRFHIEKMKKLIPNRNKIPKFRVQYYFIMSICSIFFILNGISAYCFIPIWGYFCFRFIILRSEKFKNRVIYG